MDRKSLNKALFLADIAIINGDYVYDDYFVSVLTEFIYTYFNEYQEYFNLIFEFNLDNDGKYIVQLFSDTFEYNNILDLVSRMDDESKFKILFKNIDDKSILMISEMAVLFCSFLNEYNEFMNSSYVRIKQ